LEVKGKGQNVRFGKGKHGIIRDLGKKHFVTGVRGSRNVRLLQGRGKGGGKKTRANKQEWKGWNLGGAQQVKKNGRARHEGCLNPKKK